MRRMKYMCIGAWQTVIDVVWEGSVNDRKEWMEMSSLIVKFASVAM